MEPPVQPFSPYRGAKPPEPPEPPFLPPGAYPGMPTMDGESVPVYRPTFMKALEMLFGTIPAMNLEAKNSTIVDTLLANKELKNSLFNFGLTLTSSVVELIDKDRNPKAYGMVKFIRNVFALEKLYRQVKERFVVHGGSNMDEWNKLVRVVTEGTDGASIDYVPPGLNEADTFISMIGVNRIIPSAAYAMYKCDTEHEAIILQATNGEFGFSLNEWSCGPRRYKAESIYRYGPAVHLANDDNGSVKFITEHPSQGFRMLQVFRLARIDSDGNEADGHPPFYIVFGTPVVLTASVQKESVELPAEMFANVHFIGKANLQEAATRSSRLDASRINIANMLLKKMKFRMFDPKTTVIAVMGYLGAESANNSQFFPRITRYSDEGAIHVLSEYDTIRDGLGKCIALGKSRGYAFVGAPGTGKTIMMNQLTNEFMDSPVVKFSMRGFSDPTAMDKHRLLNSIVDVVRSLSDAGFGGVFLCCDDIDSVDMSSKNGAVESLITMLDGLHAMLHDSTAIIFMCTVNDPTKMHSTIIKRGKRIDEVIEVPYPDVDTIRRLINPLKNADDRTDYTGPQFAPLLERMAADKFSLADISTMMTNLQIYGSPGESGEFSPATLETAISRIENSKENTAKTYEG